MTTPKEQARKAARRWKDVEPARSRQMSLIRGRDTVPEMIVRRLAHSLGYRYGLHCKDLPGKPDLVFRSRKKIIFVHGCYWHGHKGCRRARLPNSRQEFWSAKIRRNAERDAANEKRLRETGWEVLVVWECETAARQRVVLSATIASFLQAAESSASRAAPCKKGPVWTPAPYPS